jgi:hypothetical protein
MLIYLTTATCIGIILRSTCCVVLVNILVATESTNATCRTGGGGNDNGKGKDKGNCGNGSGSRHN